MDLTLQFADGTEFAILNNHIRKVLLEIISLPSIELEALANIPTVRDIIHRAKKASDAIVQVNINVYGAAEHREHIQKTFSAHKVWLQHPEHQRAGTKYDNPHLIVFPDIQLPNQRDIINGGASDAPRTEKEKFDKALVEVYARLKRDSRLTTMEGDTRLKTDLLQ
jgi:hypothetical protein